MKFFVFQRDEIYFPWGRLLCWPPQQALVVERMHSGARRFVILDFGSSVLLTDLMIPSCVDLVSLSIDIWNKSEELDGTRLAVAGDIGYKPLVISDLQPPPVCRYLKVRTIQNLIHNLVNYFTILFFFNLFNSLIFNFIKS